MYQLNTKKIIELSELFSKESTLFRVFAGPCSVESQTQLSDLSRQINLDNMHVLRAGTFKARTNPNSFQGLGAEGIDLLVKAKFDLGKPIVTEILNINHLYEHFEHVDILQVGTRNMYNYELLKEIGLSKKPVILKRGFSATIEEFLSAASYISKNGNDHIILCERGIRTFETATRNTLDLSSIPIIKSRSPYPIIVDPSHGTGRRDLINPMSKAAMACGADGIMVEVHPDPDTALSDGHQSITPKMFNEMMSEISTLAPMFGRHL